MNKFHSCHHCLLWICAALVSRIIDARGRVHFLHWIWRKREAAFFKWRVRCCCRRNCSNSPMSKAPCVVINNERVFHCKVTDGVLLNQVMEKSHSLSKPSFVFWLVIQLKTYKRKKRKITYIKLLNQLKWLHHSYIFQITYLFLHILAEVLRDGPYRISLTS